MANLWIRTQNKTELTKVDSLGYKEYRNTLEKHNFYIYCKNAYTLGEYKTKERCIEIIDEIQKLLQSNGLIIFKDIECDGLSPKDIEPFKPLFYQIGVVSSDKGEIIIHNVEDLVYEMPEE